MFRIEGLRRSHIASVAGLGIFFDREFYRGRFAGHRPARSFDKIEQMDWCGASSCVSESFYFVNKAT